MVKKSLAYYKNKVLWTLFSKYIRLKYSTNGLVRCITCGTWKYVKEMQAGHFIPGRHNSILFDERNVHPQCYHCNIGLKGNSIEYYAFMQKRYGQEVIDELRALDRKSVNIKDMEIMEKIELYTNKVTAMEIMQ